MSITEPVKLLLKVPAKINLYLEILGKRENGYHEIRSVVVPVSLYDVVALEKTDSVIETTVETSKSLIGETMHLPEPKDNLVTKAAVFFREQTGYSGGVRIRLEKNIPVGSGLGGGSSDAAAVLIGLNMLWQTGIPKEDLMAIGSQLGCDIPAMIHGGAVCVEGFGEKVTPIPVISEWWMVIANPGFNVSTRDIYLMYSSALTSIPLPISSMVSALREGNVEAAAQGLFNGLQKTVFRKYPLIEMVAEGLGKVGAIEVSLSGSGAAVFGLARNEEHAHSIDKCAGRALGFEFWSRVVRTLPDGVMVAHGPLEA